MPSDAMPGQGGGPTGAQLADIARDHGLKRHELLELSRQGSPLRPAAPGMPGPEGTGGAEHNPFNDLGRDSIGETAADPWAQSPQLDDEKPSLRLILKDFLSTADEDGQQLSHSRC